MSPPETGPLSPGALLAGRYRIEAQIGQGGAGAVYKATHLQLRRPVAIKILLPQRQTMSVYRARFEREARVASALRHPGTVEIYDFGEADGCMYLVMALLEGQTLRHYVGPQHPLELPGILRLGRDLSDVLISAHQIGLVHRDLKPENVFIEPNPRPEQPPRAVVVDFGLAYIEADADRGRVTETGMMSGTPQYMSPEQCRAKAVGPASDVYALGCILYEAITGRVPFDGPLFELLSAHLYTTPVMPERPPGFEDPPAPRGLQDLVMRMLRKRPDDRPSAADCLPVFEALLQRPGARERGRDARMLGSRASRMLATPPPQPTADADLTEPPEGLPEVGVLGALASELSMALKLNGLKPVPLKGPEDPGPAVVLIRDQPEATLQAWVKAGRAVITVADPGDVKGLARLLRLGVAEVIPAGASAAEHVTRIKAALRRSRR